MLGIYTEKITDKNQHYLMSKILNISQPRVYPHITYLDKIAKSDLFIVSDDLVVKKNLFEIRNKYFCKLSREPKYLNLPIVEKPSFNQLKISDTSVFEKHKKILTDNYRKYQYFDISILEKTFQYDSDSYFDFFLSHLTALFELLDINTPIELVSSVNTTKNGQERLSDIIQHFNGTHYISGICGADYIHQLPVPFEFHNSTDRKFQYRFDDDNWYMIYDMIFSIGLDSVKDIIHR